MLSAQLMTAPTGRPSEMRNLAPDEPPRPARQQHTLGFHPLQPTMCTKGYTPEPGHKSPIEPAVVHPFSGAGEKDLPRRFSNVSHYGIHKLYLRDSFMYTFRLPS